MEHPYQGGIMWRQEMATGQGLNNQKSKQVITEAIVASENSGEPNSTKFPPRRLANWNGNANMSLPWN